MKLFEKFCLVLAGIVLLAANAHAGRWITPDPMDIPEHIERDPHPFLDLNPYTFVGNDPLDWIDPFGLDKIVVYRGGIPIVLDNSASTPQRTFPQLNQDVFGNQLPTQGEIMMQEYAKSYALMLASEAGGQALGAAARSPLARNMLARASSALRPCRTPTGRELAELISPAQKELLKQLFGSGPKGAADALKALQEGGALPEGLSKETLELYQQIAQRSIQQGLDTTGAQAGRLQVIQQALGKLK